MRQKLQAQGLTIFDAPDPFIATAARRTGFVWSKFGNVDTFFVFSQFPDLDVAGLRNFSARAFEWANRNKGVSLPNGLFEAVVCYPVAVTANAHPALEQSIRSEAAPKHYGAFEMPVVYDTARNVLYYCESTPIWGAAYYKGFREEIQKTLF